MAANLAPLDILKKIITIIILNEMQTLLTLFLDCLCSVFSNRSMSVLSERLQVLSFFAGSGGLF